MSVVCSKTGWNMINTIAGGRLTTSRFARHYRRPVFGFASDLCNLTPCLITFSSALSASNCSRRLQGKRSYKERLLNNVIG